MNKYHLSNTPAIIPKVPIGIIGVGSYLPPTIVTNADFTNLTLSSEEDEFIKNKSGIKKRHWSKEESHTDMAIKAAACAIDNAKIDVLEIDMIVVTHITRDLSQLTPPNSVSIQTALGAKNATAINIDQGFTGWMYALITGMAFIAAGFYKTVLVVSGESILQNTNSHIFKSMLIGDGAGAFILRETKQGYGCLAYHLMSWQYPEIAAEVKVESNIASPFAKTPSLKAFFTIAPNSFQRDLPFVENFLPTSLNECMKALDLKNDNIARYIFAQKFAWLNRRWAKNLNINYDQVHDTLEQHACMETSSIPIITHDALKINKIRRDDFIAFADLGSNWSVASAIFKWF